MNVKIAITLLTVIAPSTVGSAAASLGECSGILHAENSSLEFGGRSGESEGICVVAKADRRKVLAACSAGKFCRVKGILTPCRGSGECTEISRIVSGKRN